MWPAEAACEAPPGKAATASGVSQSLSGGSGVNCAGITRREYWPSVILRVSTLRLVAFTTLSCFSRCGLPLLTWVVVPPSARARAPPAATRAAASARSGSEGRALSDSASLLVLSVEWRRRTETAMSRSAPRVLRASSASSSLSKPKGSGPRRKSWESGTCTTPVAGRRIWTLPKRWRSMRCGTSFSASHSLPVKQADASRMVKVVLTPADSGLTPRLSGWSGSTTSSKVSRKDSSSLSPP